MYNPQKRYHDKMQTCHFSGRRN